MTYKLCIAICMSLFVGSVFSTTSKAPTDTSSTAAKVDGSTTIAPESPCDGLDDEACCNITDCQFISCKDISNDTLTLKGCYQRNTSLSAACVANTSLPACPADSAAPTVETTTANKTDQPTTSAQPLKDVCENLMNKTACCANSEQSCIYISCTNKTDQPHEGCHSNSSDFTMICKDVAKDMCKSEPITSPKPDTTTKSKVTDGPTEKISTPEGTTQAGNNTSSTASPGGDENAQTGDKEQTQHFDGASFVGGMVLIIGLVGIAFFGMKFYKARTERNYHTL